MAVYSERFFLGQLPATWQELYLVPVGAVVVLRDVEFTVPATSPTTIALSVQSASGGSAPFVSAVISAPPLHYQWQGRVVLNAGDSLWGYTGDAGASGLICGYFFPA